MKYYLYRHIRPDKNEVFYIGIGTYFKSSKYGRAYATKRRNTHWKNVVKLNPNYGIEIILESDDISFIKNREIEFIKLYGRRDLGLGTLVNMTNGGEGKHGVILTKETKNKMSFSAKRNMTDYRKKELVLQLNKNHSTRGKFGSKHHRSIKVYQYSTSGELIKEWDSLMDIERKLNYGTSHISQCINNKRNTSKGFIWKKSLI